MTGTQGSWNRNELQFPRLLAEIRAVGLAEHQWDGLLVSMDLESDELSELFERAEAEWEGIKRDRYTG